MQSSEFELHEHRCPTCDGTWICARLNCGTHETCDQCDIERQSQWLEDQGFEPQRTLALVADEETSGEYQ